jgi:hypothetical protein
MKTKLHIVTLFCCFLVQSCFVQARSIYVNPVTGSDLADGSLNKSSAAIGPVRSIAKAVSLARAGDTIYLGGFRYKGRGEYVGFYGNISGQSGEPIVVDGQNAIIDGSIPLDPNQWSEVSPNLYKNTNIFEKTTNLYNSEDWVGQFCFIYDGICNRMGISGKWAYTSYKNPEDLKPGEWTCQRKERAFYVKTAPDKNLADYHIEVPVVNSGVQIDGTIHHIVFRNITVTHVINDGFALTNGREPNSTVRDIYYENIKAINICDDGFSAHGDCDVKVDGFIAQDCATGIASYGSSYNTRVITRNIQGADIYFGAGRHVVTNSYLDCQGGLGCVLVMVWPNLVGFNACSLTLDNVFIKGNRIGSNMIKVDGKNACLDCNNLTMCDLSVSAINGGKLRFDNSVIAGKSSSINIQRNAIWQAENNVYDVNSISVGGIVYAPKDFESYQSVTGTDKWSRVVKIDLEKCTRSSDMHGYHDTRVGCDMSRIPHPNASASIDGGK